VSNPSANPINKTQLL